jgi:phage baseplate assembly protein W
MTGMSRTTGAAIDGLDSIRESVADILGTPIGARVGRRDYGSLLPELIDQPMTAANILRIFAASALAITRWEDRLRLRRVTLAAGARPGAATLNIEAYRTDTAPATARTRFALSL